MLIISGEDFLKLQLNRTYAVVPNASMTGNEAFLFHQKLHVSPAVSTLFSDADIADEVFKSLRITIPETAPSV
jgi:hypothetical protein